MNDIQDGWMLSYVSDEDWEHYSDLGHAIEAGLKGVHECNSYNVIDAAWVGRFTICRAYRVQLHSIASEVASVAISCLTDGTSLETFYIEPGIVLKSIEDELRQAFAANIERICGPWYEVLGTDSLLMEVERSFGRPGSVLTDSEIWHAPNREVYRVSNCEGTEDLVAAAVPLINKIIHYVE